jgi:hypothetical protein
MVNIFICVPYIREVFRFAVVQQWDVIIPRWISFLEEIKNVKTKSRLTYA